MPSNGSSVFDVDEALERIGGDRDLLREMSEMFLRTIRGDMEQLDRAIVNRDREMVRQNAHRIKGSVGNFGMKNSYESASALEHGAFLTLEEVQLLHRRLKNDVHELNKALMGFLMEP